ncbi:MAG TPA: hypothetical protein VKA78_06255 [Pyrinomonadaceae bacterium]|nr:hypothetical protein [Pyrinomonadaceae bacterium]
MRPRILRDVPARNLAYRLAPDVSPPAQNFDDPLEKFEAVTNDFATRRKDEALVRTVVSPDGRRVLALYGTADEPGSAFRIDLYNSDGQFLRNLIPPDISCVFPETVTWSPDGNFINFIAHKRVMPSPTPTPPNEPEPEEATPVASPSIAPLFPPVASFNTEQIYICNRDGYDLKPLTSREGLIYFYFVWAPDGHAMAALACKEDEWNARERQFGLPAGRPRVIAPDGAERLLDDALTEALPVWSPDASKIATAFDSDIAIYDDGGKTPTQGRLPLGEQLIAASVVYEEKTATKKANVNGNSAATPTPTTRAAPPSFNPIVRLDWRAPETLYFETAFVRLMPNETINTFQRWHLLNLSAQAAILK